MELKQIIYKMNKARRDFIRGAQKLVVDRTVANYLIRCKAVEIVNESIPIKDIKYDPVIIKLIDKNLFTKCSHRFHKHLFVPYSWARAGKMYGVYKRWLKNLRKGMTVAVCWDKWKNATRGTVVKVTGNSVFVEYIPLGAKIGNSVTKFVEGKAQIPTCYALKIAPIEGEKGSSKFPYTVYKEWLR
jgi:hypothetical protein